MIDLYEICKNSHHNPDFTNRINCINYTGKEVAMEKPYSPELITLRHRVIQGNEKLIKAWSQLKEMTHNTEEWATQFERWHKANELLSLLATELKVKYNFNECLYMENGKKTKKCLPPGDEIGCRVCTSDYPWWSNELMPL
ncbi:hypothetical protein KKF45_05095 [Patescibacteria group bacterium]|nr:hypothetical protein [Patescibacteria group bacterium]